MRKLSTRAMSETSELWPCLRAGESTSESACKDERLHVESMEHPRFMERAMGIEPNADCLEATECTSFLLSPLEHFGTQLRLLFRPLRGEHLLERGHRPRE